MSRKFWYRAIAFLLCFIYVCSTPMSVYAENGDEEIQLVVEQATEYLEPFEEAADALDEVLKENEVYALVYLAEAYAIKEDADPNSATLASVASGQEVEITGVAEDEGQNIWYEVSYVYDGGEVEGFIERKYLAFANEYLLEWESEYVQSRAMSLWSRRRVVSYPDIEQFPESYRDALYELKEKYPNWTFVKMNTDIDWDYAIEVQCEGSRSLIYAKTAKESWKNGMYDSTWAYCTPGIVKYYFDPRNSLTEKEVFQFEHLGYNASYNTVEATQKAVEGTFMEGKIPDSSKTYAEVLTQVGKDNNVSPILLASRIRQEQGTDGTSPLISGTYKGYEGLYNYYNIGATGQTTQAVVTSGLKKARELGWTDRIKALSGGATFLVTNYIKAGQDSLYLQKFDVDNRQNGILWHQYMQNIQAPTTEAQSTYKTYQKIGILEETPFVFRIPVYNDMPEYACVQPGSEDKITLSTTKIENLPVDATSVLTTYINGAQNTSVAMQFTSSDTSVATVDENGVITGISPGTATITVKKKENAASANTVTCTVKVIKADIALEDIETPKLEEVVYSPNTTLKNIPLPKGYTWVDSTIVPTVENSGYSVTYNPDDSKYNTLSLTLPLTVKKATLDVEDIELPKELTAVAGTELKSVALPIGFTWDEPDKVLPKKVGTYTYTASYCLDVANYEILEDVSLSLTIICKTHEFGDWTGEHADCTNDGKLVRSCEICDEKEILEETAPGHMYESEITKQPTTSEEGVRTFTCATCGDTYTEEIAKLPEEHKHSYTEKVTKKATCTETGEKTFTCSCKDSYTETIEALGHDIVDGSCGRCDYVEPSLPTHTHSYTESTRTATCTEKGEIIYTCSCGDSYSEELQELGHNMKNGDCTRCDYTTNPPKEEPETKPSSSEDESESESKPETKPSSSEEESESSSSEEESKTESKPETKPSSSEEESESSSSEEESKTESKPETKPSSSEEESESSSSVEESKTESKPETKPSSSSAKDDDKDSDDKKNDNKKDDDKKDDDDEPSGETASSESSGNKNNNQSQSTKPAQSSAASGTQSSQSSAASGTQSSQSSVAQTPASSTKPSSSSTTKPTASSTVVQSSSREESSSQSSEVVSSAETVVTESNAEASVEANAEAVPTVQINMQDSTVLNADKLIRVSDNDEVVRLNMPQDITWDIDVASIADRESVSVNMAVSLGTAEVPEEVVSAIAPDNNYQLMSLEHTGEFGFDAVLTIPVEPQYLGMTANLFYYNPTTGGLEFVDSCQVSADNRASFNMNHASDYVIVYGSTSMENLAVTTSVVMTNASGIDSKVVAAIIIVVGLVIAAATAGIVLFMRKRAANKYYYFDEEDDLLDDRIK